MFLKNLLVIQARMGSKRLPGKVMLKIGKYRIIELLFKRLSKAKMVDQIIVATSISPNNDSFCKFLTNKQIKFIRGSEQNVLQRFIDAAKSYNPEYIIRITADCPFLDSKMLDKMIRIFEKNKIDYLSNSNPPTFPDGLDIEIISYEALKRANKLAKSKYDREHVTTFIKKKKFFKKINYVNKKDLSNYRWTLDTKEDFLLIKKIFIKLNYKIHFNWKDILKIKKKYPNIFKINL